MAAERFHVKLLVVRGMGSFPLDMLRYERACPDTETDSWQGVGGQSIGAHPTGKPAPVTVDGMPCPYCSAGCETRGLPQPTIKDNHVACFCPCHRLAEMLAANQSNREREVRLISFSRNPDVAQISIDRWRSFGWMLVRAERDDRVIYEDPTEAVKRAKAKRAQ